MTRQADHPRRHPIRVEHSRSRVVVAFVGKRYVGTASAWEDSRGDFVILNSYVVSTFRRRGVATAMYKSIEQENGKLLQPAASLSDDAFEFWKRFRPSEVETDLRHWKEQLIGARVVFRGDAGAIVRASGGAATMVLDIPKPNGTETTIVIRYLNEALAAAGSQTLPLMAAPSARRGVQRRPEEHVQEDAEQELLCEVPHD